MSTTAPSTRPSSSSPSTSTAPSARLCVHCKLSRAKIQRAKTRDRLCVPCFLAVFELEVHHTITSTKLFNRGDHIAIGASGGKDSTVLAAVLKTLNERYDYGLHFTLLSIDEGIKGYRDDSLETVKRNAEQYGMPLEIVSYRDLYGWTMDEVVQQIGKKGNCTVCGVFRRQALDRGSEKLGVSHVVTGHNADDMAETVLMNLLRGDLPRLHRCTAILTSSSSSPVRRSKPLKYAYEKEIVLYAHHRKLDYFSTECLYSPEAFRGSARALIKSLERVRPSAILDVVRSGEAFVGMVPSEISGVPQQNTSTPAPVVIPPPPPQAQADDEPNAHCGGESGGEMAVFEQQLRANEAAAPRETEIKMPPKQKMKQTLRSCKKCGYMSSQELCKACVILEDLNKHRPKLGIEVELDDEEEEASSSVRRKMEALEMRNSAIEAGAG